MGRSGLAWLGLVLATGTPAHAGTTPNSLSGFRGWSEPVVRNWQQTNAELTRESAGHDHGGHGGMPASPPDSASPASSDAPASSGLDHQGMPHGNPSKDPTASPTPSQAPASAASPAPARPAQAPDHDAMSHGSHHP